MAKVENGMEAMLDIFIFETNTLLEQLDEILLRTEEENNFTDDDINEIFRIMHTIKGSAAMMGFDELSTLAHKAEDMFFVIRDDTDLISDVGFVYDLVFAASDFYKAEIDLIQNSDEYIPSDSSQIQQDLEKAISLLTHVNSAEMIKAVSADSSSSVAAPTGSMTVRVFFEEGAKMENLRAFLLINKIREACDSLSYIPSDVESNAESILN